MQNESKKWLRFLICYLLLANVCIAQPEEEEDNDSSVLELLLIGVGVTIYGIGMGGVASMERVGVDLNSDGHSDFGTREKGEALIPFARLDLDYQYDSSQSHGFGSRLEGGYGCFGFEVRNRHYAQREIEDTDLLQWHFLYRMCPNEHFEVDFGVGQGVFSQDVSGGGTSVSMPILIHPRENWGIEYRPTTMSIGDDRLYEHDLGFMLREDYFSIRVGYRWIFSEFSRFEGLYLGMSHHF